MVDAAGGAPFASPPIGDWSRHAIRALQVPLSSGGYSMSTTRRHFLKFSAAAGSALAFGARLPRAMAADAVGGPAAAGGKKTLLVLGGTMFLGPAVVEAATKLGYRITLFNRGKTYPQLFPDVEKLRGNRDGDLKALEGRTWDAVADTSGYVPRVVRASAELLKDCKQYVFISTMSVYSDNSRPGMDESGPIATMPDEKSESVREHYGALKALCEKAAETTLPGKVTTIRPGLIVGPMDPSDRFTYWPVRVRRGGEVLAPGAPSDPVQFIDVRDLGNFVMYTIDKHITGTFNATGPAKELTIGGLLDACRQVTRSNATFTWVDAAFLEQEKVSAWGDMPVWVPPTGESAGFARSSVNRAVKAGLMFRPVTDTIRDTLAWWDTLPTERREKLKSGITPEREKEVLAAWHVHEKKG
jgi:2'-hydroxyisoflavone reductase